jgi:predicted RNA-binding Zn-ribbon protein involved in translation (DUF1610 family)
VSGVCSRHHPTLGPVEGCELCHTQPWELLGVSVAAWDQQLADAKSEGEINCAHCGFAMFKKTCRERDGRYMCPCCGKYFRET